VQYRVFWSTPDWSDRRQGCRQVSTGLPPSSGLGREEKRSSVAAPVDGTCDGAAGPGHAKTSSPGRKTVPGPSRGGAR
jgi:hypothetical protein